MIDERWNWPMRLENLEHLKFVGGDFDGMKTYLMPDVKLGWRMDLGASATYVLSESAELGRHLAFEKVPE